MICPKAGSRKKSSGWSKGATPKRRKPGPKSEQAQKESTNFIKNLDKDFSDEEEEENKSITKTNTKTQEFDSTFNIDFKDIVFCLDCENCNTQDCSHMNHPRKIIENKVDHIQNFGHGRYQNASNFVKIPPVEVQDLAYHSEEGPKLRKLYKKYTAQNQERSLKIGINLIDYENNRKCKIPSCDFESQSVVHMFRHIRQEHFEIQFKSKVEGSNFDSADESGTGSKNDLESKTEEDDGLSEIERIRLKNIEDRQKMFNELFHSHGDLKKACKK